MMQTIDNRYADRRAGAERRLNEDAAFTANAAEGSSDIQGTNDD